MSLGGTRRVHEGRLMGGRLGTAQPAVTPFLPPCPSWLHFSTASQRLAGRVDTASVKRQADSRPLPLAGTHPFGGTPGHTVGPSGPGKPCLGTSLPAGARRAPRPVAAPRRRPARRGEQRWGGPRAHPDHSREPLKTTSGFPVQIHFHKEVLNSGPDRCMPHIKTRLINYSHNLRGEKKKTNEIYF